MQPEYLEMLKKKIIERKEIMNLVYSKIKLMTKLDEEIQELRKKAEDLDNQITVQS